MSRAFAKRDDDCEPADEIWIVFIQGPAVREDNMKIHSAAELARRCDFDDSHKFQHGHSVERAIPREHVLYEVTLQTLIDRGLRKHWFCGKSNSRSTFRHREPVETVRPRAIDLVLGGFARTFGARAPSNWISTRLLDDCFRARIVDYEMMVTGAYRVVEEVDWVFLDLLHDGIDTALNEWALADVESKLDCQAFEEWRGEMEDLVREDLADCWQVWHSTDSNGVRGSLSPRERLIYERESNKLRLRRERQRTAVEAAAIRIGL